MNLVGKAYSSISLADLCTLLGQTEQEVKLGEYVYFMCYLWACFSFCIYLCVYLNISKMIYLQAFIFLESLYNAPFLLH